MTKILKSLLNILIIFVFSNLFFGNAFSSNSILEANKDDFILGNPEAKVTIIEYASLSCNHCAKFHINTLPKIIENYVDTGKAKIIFRDFPFNYPALLGSMVLRCIPQDSRFEYSSALYKLQSKWVNRDSKKTMQELYKILQSGGMTKNEFDLVVCFNFLDRNLFPEIQGALKAGGLLFYDTFNFNYLKYSDFKKEWVLTRGELLTAFANFQILRYQETDTGEKGFTSFVGQKPYEN